MDVYEFGLVGQWIQFSEKVSPRCGLYLEWKHNNTVTNDIQSHNRSDSNDESEKGSGSPPNSVRSKHVTEGDGEFDLRGKIDPLVHILEIANNDTSLISTTISLKVKPHHVLQSIPSSLSAPSSPVTPSVVPSASLSSAAPPPATTSDISAGIDGPRSMTQTQQQSLTEKVNASASDLTIGTIRLELKQFLNKMKSPSKHAKAMNLKLRSQNNHVIKVTLLIRRVLSGVDSAAAEEKLANLDVDCTYIGGTKDGGVQAHDDSRIDAAAASYLSPSAVRKARQLFKVMVTQTIDFTSPIPPPLAPPTTKEIEMMMKKRMKRRKRSRSKQQKKTLLPHGNQERDETRKVKSVGADDGEGNTKAAVVNRDDNSGEDEENEDNKNNDEYILEIEKENDMLAGLAEKLKTLTEGKEEKIAELEEENDILAQSVNDLQHDNRALQTSLAEAHTKVAPLRQLEQKVNEQEKLLSNMEFSIENQKLQMVSMMQDNVEMEMKVKTLQHSEQRLENFAQRQSQQILELEDKLFALFHRLDCHTQRQLQKDGFFAFSALSSTSSPASTKTTISFISSNIAKLTPPKHSSSPSTAKISSTTISPASNKQ